MILIHVSIHTANKNKNVGTYCLRRGSLQHNLPVELCAEAPVAVLMVMMLNKYKESTCWRFVVQGGHRCPHVYQKANGQRIGCPLALCQRSTRYTELWGWPVQEVGPWAGLYE